MNRALPKPAFFYSKDWKKAKAIFSVLQKQRKRVLAMRFNS